MNLNREQQCYICKSPATRTLVRWITNPEIARYEYVCAECPPGGADHTLGYSIQPLILLKEVS